MNDCEDEIEFLNRVEVELCSSLRKESLKFINIKKIINNFYNKKNRWIEFLSNRENYYMISERGKVFREIYETVNELSVANNLLLKEDCLEMEYERK